MFRADSLTGSASTMGQARVPCPGHTTVSRTDRALLSGNLHSGGRMHAQSVIWFCVTQWTITLQVPLSIGFFRQDLPDPVIKPMSPVAPSLAGRFFYHWATWEAPRGVMALLKTVQNNCNGTMGVSALEKNREGSWVRFLGRADFV